MSYVTAKQSLNIVYVRVCNFKCVHSPIIILKSCIFSEKAVKSSEVCFLSSPQHFWLANFESHNSVKRLFIMLTVLVVLSVLALQDIEDVKHGFNPFCFI